jgi:hypothetical protein
MFTYIMLTLENPTAGDKYDRVPLAAIVTNW